MREIVNYGEPRQIKNEVLAGRFVMPVPSASKFLEFGGFLRRTGFCASLLIKSSDYTF